MPKVYNWKFLYKKSFDKRPALLNYVDMNLNATINKNNKVNCTICSSRGSHKMENMMLICNNSRSNEVDLCNVRYKICHCLNSNDFFFYQLNEHEAKYKPRERIVPTRRGMTPIAKSLLIV
jgi:hypothetical protein